MQKIYCVACRKKFVCNGCLKPSTCPLLEGCIQTPRAYSFHLKNFPKNISEIKRIFSSPFVDIESKRIYCFCFGCAKGRNRSHALMLRIHCWENLGDQIDIANPSER
jgi:hypothetical protein